MKAPPELVLELRGEGAGEALKPKGRQKRRDFWGTTEVDPSSVPPSYLCRGVDTAPLLKSRQRSSRLVGAPPLTAFRSPEEEDSTHNEESSTHNVEFP